MTDRPRQKRAAGTGAAGTASPGAQPCQGPGTGAASPQDGKAQRRGTAKHRAAGRTDAS